MTRLRQKRLRMLSRTVSKRGQPNKNKDLAAPAGSGRYLLDSGLQASLKCPPLTQGLADRRALIFSERATGRALIFPTTELAKFGCRVRAFTGRSATGKTFINRQLKE